MVYATVTNDNVEALLGYDVIPACLQNSRKSHETVATSQIVWHLHDRKWDVGSIPAS